MRALTAPRHGRLTYDPQLRADPANAEKYGQAWWAGYGAAVRTAADNRVMVSSLPLPMVPTLSERREGERA